MYSDVKESVEENEEREEEEEEEGNKMLELDEESSVVEREAVVDAEREDVDEDMK